MAVDASHLNLIPPQRMNPNIDFAVSNQGFILGFNNNVPAQMGLGSGNEVPLVPGMPENRLPLHQSPICNSVQPKTSINTDSGLTYNVPAPRKRPRDSFDQFTNLPANYLFPRKNSNDHLSQFPSFLGEQILPCIDQYQLDIDAIISQHTKKIKMELEERQKQHARILMGTIGEGVMKKLKEKDEQIQTIGKMNLALQERVKSLYVENQLWRDLAQTNEATANSLRTNLEQVLAHVSDERLPAGGGGGRGAVAEDDAESCCGSNDYGNEEEEEGADETSAERRILAGEAQGGMGSSRLAVEAQDKVEGNVNVNVNNNYNKKKSRRMCKVCGERESCVLLLPCRHLCLCTLCGSTLHHTCPLCNSNMNATVHVNLSS